MFVEFRIDNTITDDEPIVLTTDATVYNRFKRTHIVRKNQALISYQPID
jgi:hypothetical protein